MPSSLRGRRIVGGLTLPRAAAGQRYPWSWRVVKRRQRLSKVGADDMAVLLRAMQSELNSGAMSVAAFNSAAVQAGISGADARFANPFDLLDCDEGPTARVRRCCATSWNLHRDRGIALAPLLAMAENLLTDLADAQERVAQEISSIRASTRLLSGLPIISPLMGIAIGCNPWAWLFGTRAGVTVAIAGMLLLVANHWLVALIARKAIA